MIFRPKLIAFTISLCLPLTLLSACALGPTRLACLPELPAPPESVIDALAETIPTDPKAGEWTVELERHLESQDAAREYCAHHGRGQ